MRPRQPWSTSEQEYSSRPPRHRMRSGSPSPKCSTTTATGRMQPPGLGARSGAPGPRRRPRVGRPGRAGGYPARSDPTSAQLVMSISAIVTRGGCEIAKMSAADTSSSSIPISAVLKARATRRPSVRGLLEDLRAADRLRFDERRAYPLRAVFESDGLVKRPDRVLGRRIHAVVIVHVSAGGRRNRYEVPPLLFDHDRETCMGHVEHPHHVHLDHALPVVEVGAEGRTDDAKARVVDDDIKSASVVHSLVHRVFRLGRVGDVGAHRDDLGTFGPCGFRERLEATSRLATATTR